MVYKSPSAQLVCSAASERANLERDDV
jgi:hypothetical protein